MADQGYSRRGGDGLGGATKGGLFLGAMLTLGTVIAILIPTVGPAVRKRR